MVNVEAREKDVKAAEAELKAETAEIEKEKEDARRVTAEDQKKLAEWNAKRDGLRRGIPEDLLRHYERVMKFRGTGLAEVRDQKCMGCQVMLRPQTYNEVLNGEKHRVLRFLPEGSVLQSGQRSEARAAVEAAHARRRRRVPRPMRRRPGFTVPITAKKAKCSWSSRIGTAPPRDPFTKCTPDGRLAKC